MYLSGKHLHPWISGSGYRLFYGAVLSTNLSRSWPIKGAICKGNCTRANCSYSRITNCWLSRGSAGRTRIGRFNRAHEGVLPLVAIFLGLTALTVWGFLIGSTLQHIWGFLALFFVIVVFAYAPLAANSYFIPNSVFPARPLGMVWAISEPSADLAFNPSTELARSLFYLMILTIGLLLFTIFSRVTRSGHSRAKFSLITTMTLVVVSVSSIAVLLIPEPFKKDGFPLSCESSGNLEICQYQVYKPLIPRISEIGEHFSAIVPTESILAVPATEEPQSAVPIPHPRRSEHEWEQAIAQSFADYLAGARICLGLRDNGTLASEEALQRV